MKIGIVTYHRTLNYGACLQAIATRVALEKLGNEVYYVDYWPEYHSLKYKPFSLKKLKYISVLGGIKYILDSLRYYKYRRERINNFTPFFEKYIYPYCCDVNEEYDVIIYGSDQIWRKQPELKDYNPIYFGMNNFRTKRHVAYSASMGILPASDRDKDKVKKLVSHLDKIAVREENLKELLIGLGFGDTRITLDPTLLLDKNEWDSIIPSKSPVEFKYMLLYSIGNSAFDIEKVKGYAKKHGCELVVLSGNAKQKSTKLVYTTDGPDKFLSLIRHAECVFTSSFHGLAFSIIFEKEFFASYYKNSNRAETLLNLLEIKGRLLPPKTSIPQDVPPIDYKEVRSRLEVLRQDSLSFLKSI